MRTSEEIYHRVRWDPRFDPARFVMGINIRGAEPKRVPLAAFVPGGDIPWHRVLFVEADGEIVWDRTTGVDRIDDSPAGRVRAPRRLRPPFFTACTPHGWSPSAAWSPSAGWAPVTAPAGRGAPAFLPRAPPPGLAAAPRRVAARRLGAGHRARLRRRRGRRPGGGAGADLEHALGQVRRRPDRHRRPAPAAARRPRTR